MDVAELALNKFHLLSGLTAQLIYELNFFGTMGHLVKDIISHSAMAEPFSLPMTPNDLRGPSKREQGHVYTRQAYSSHSIIFGPKCDCFHSLYHLPGEQAMRDQGDILGQIFSCLHKALLEVPFLGCPQPQRKYLPISCLKLCGLGPQESLEELIDKCEQAMGSLSLR